MATHRSGRVRGPTRMPTQSRGHGTRRERTCHLATEMEILDRRSLTEADARAIAELLCAVWPKPGRTVETRTAELLAQWRDYGGPEAQHPRSVVIREGGRVIAHAGADPRTIGTSRGELTILALGKVCTHPDERGRRLGAAVVHEVFKLVDDGTFRWSLFQTSHKVRPFYEKLGACLVENRIVNSLAEDPGANPFWDNVVMRYAARTGWPAGQIDLRGPGY
jgi:predicted N-acetyltransferase YhbS